MSFTHAAEESRIGLRSSYKKLSVSQVQSIPHISIRKKEDWGFYGHSTINHSYDLKTINGDKVVIDHATGLMWHQSGSNDYIRWDKVKDWVKGLNSSGYAGHDDWRLPTVEEAVSLLESSRNVGSQFIDTVFDTKQSGIWTGDKYGPKTTWDVQFGSGGVYWNFNHGNNHVRPVRSGK